MPNPPKSPKLSLWDIAEKAGVGKSPSASAAPQQGGSLWDQAAAESPQQAPVRTAEQFRQFLAQRAAEEAARKPSLWEKANTGLIPADFIARAATGMTTQQLTDLQNSAGTDDADDPNRAAAMAFYTGVARDASNVLSSFSSPLSLATVGLDAVSQAPRAVGAVANTARAINTGVGLGMGVQGAVGAYDAGKDIAASGLTPENSQQLLNSGAQVAGSAGAFRDTAVAARNAASSVYDSVVPSGEKAITNALQPNKKVSAQVQQDVRTVGPELKNEFDAQIQRQSQSPNPGSNLEVTRDTAQKLRMKTADELDAKLAANGAQHLDLQQIDKVVDQAANSRIGNALDDNVVTEVAHFKNALLRNPISVGAADQMVQDLSAEIRTRTAGKTPSERDAMMKSDPMLKVLDSLKSELQVQVDQKFQTGDYRGLRGKYAALRHIEDLAQAQLDKQVLEKPISGWKKTALDFGSGAVGAMVGGHYGGNEGGLVGAFSGFRLARMLESAVQGRINSPDYLIQRGMDTMGSPRQPIPYSTQNGLPVAAVATGQRNGGKR